MGMFCKYLGRHSPNDVNTNVKIGEQYWGLGFKMKVVFLDFLISRAEDLIVFLCQVPADK